MQNSGSLLPAGRIGSSTSKSDSAGPAADQALGQRLDGRRLEQAADADLGIHARADPADQPDRQQRVPAELEEVVVDADPLDAEHLGEQPAEDLLLRRARRAARVRRRRLGRGQRAAVELAVRRQRQLVERDDRRRHHVVRQAGAQVLAQRRRRNALPDRHHIGDQPLVPGHVLARDHRGLRHAALPQQRRLDLARLDAEPAQLHLRVGAARGTPARRPCASAPGRRSGTSGRRLAHADRRRTAPPSAPRGADSRAPAQRPRCKARPPRPPAPAQVRRPAHRPDSWPSAGRSGCWARRRRRRPHAKWRRWWFRSDRRDW